MATTPTIKTVEARLTYDSRGNPTDEVYITLSDGTWTRAAITSIGTFEVDEFVFVSQAAETITKIIGPALIGKDPTDQVYLDNLMLQILDGIENEFGMSNKTLDLELISAISHAICEAGARVLNIPLYLHIANLAGNKNMVMPVPAFIVINGGSLARNRFPVKGYKEGFELVIAAITEAGYTGKVVIGMNVAASEFYGEDNTYNLNYKEESFNKAIDEKTCNAYLLKVNQFGSVTQSIEAVKLLKHAGWGVIAYSDENEIEDTFIAHLSVGLGMGQIKTGAPGSSAKYNELLLIEEELGSKAVYDGANIRKPMEH
ncbi:hypothetical protein L2E82_35669 [Cichorium intybus]|uniref:Uncharacterized protein n=1 Tax=Cichorium intybus TaxID=13427 RepID=A0ACB9BPJ8_CICIN|nr:hypothetical protein L2E82_35669 [Cichorium intybus]